MTPEQAEKFRYNVLDLTKVWPHGEFPLRPVGKLVLNENPQNYFAEIEQARFSAFDPFQMYLHVFNRSGCVLTVGGYLEPLPAPKPISDCRNSILFPISRLQQTPSFNRVCSRTPTPTGKALPIDKKFKYRTDSLGLDIVSV